MQPTSPTQQNKTQSYAASARSSVLALAPLRQHEDIRVSEHGGLLWFQLPEGLSPDLLPSIPCTYYQNTAEGCIELGTQVPTLPPLPETLIWMPILEWWKLQLGMSYLPQDESL